MITVPRVKRQGIVEFAAPSPVTAADVPFGDEWIVVRADMATVVKQSLETVFQMQIWKSFDNGITWLHVTSFGYQGDPGILAGDAVGVAVRAADTVGARLKIRLDIPAGLSFALGATVTLTRTP